MIGVQAEPHAQEIATKLHKLDKVSRLYPPNKGS